jgi:hypothetical protein
MKIKNLFLTVAASCSLFACFNSALAQGTVFTYQGRLNDNGGSANGTYDLRFRLSADSLGATFIGSSILSNGMVISNGLFTAPLDFGPVFTGSNYWLQVDVKTNGAGGYTTLLPLQRLTPSPYAIMANLASNLLGTLPTAQLSGTVGNSQLANDAVTSAKILDGTITSLDLGPNSVNSGHIIDGQVQNADLGTDAVTGAKILDGTITGSDLASTIALGRSNVLGRLDVFYSAFNSNQPSISLFGSGSQISTYGSDGQEQIRLWGNSYGEIILHDNNTNNNTAAIFSAGGTSPYLQLNQAFTSSAGALLYGDFFNQGGRLFLRSSNSFNNVELRGQFDVATPAAWGSFKDNGSERVSIAARNGTSGFGGLVDVKNNSSLNTVRLIGDSGASRGTIQLYDTDGSTLVGALEGHSGGSWLRTWDENGIATGYFGSSAVSGGFAELFQADGDLGLLLDGDSSGAGYLSVYGTNGSVVIQLDGQDSGGNGRVITQVLQITGGSDLSEQFDINAASSALQPGMVVCIDPQHPGQLMPSRSAYDRTVAGVISGAGGINPGMLMGQIGTKADGKHPVALTGRVYVLADASNGAIQPGDLLTTSSTPGHAMKVTSHDKAQGAILGKAMTGLSEGKGVVLTLVTLQ